MLPAEATVSLVRVAADSHNRTAIECPPGAWAAAGKTVLVLPFSRPIPLHLTVHPLAARRALT